MGDKKDNKDKWEIGLKIVETGIRIITSGYKAKKEAEFKMFIVKSIVLFPMTLAILCIVGYAYFWALKYSGFITLGDNALVVLGITLGALSTGIGVITAFSDKEALNIPLIGATSFLGLGILIIIVVGIIKYGYLLLYLAKEAIYLVWTLIIAILSFIWHIITSVFEFILSILSKLLEFIKNLI